MHVQRKEAEAAKCVYICKNQSNAHCAKAGLQGNAVAAYLAGISVAGAFSIAVSDGAGVSSMW